jgi:hypothetical protein
MPPASHHLLDRRTAELNMDLLGRAAFVNAHDFSESVQFTVFSRLIQDQIQFLHHRSRFVLFHLTGYDMPGTEWRIARVGRR